MLDIGKLSPDAADYYIGEVATSAEDYYTGRGESQGRWVGSLAETLGLQGAVNPEDFRAVLDGRHPQTGERLVRSRTGGHARSRASAPNQPGLFDADSLDVPRVAARLRVTVGRVRQLLWAGQRGAAMPSSRPKRYLAGAKVPRTGSGGEAWEVPRMEVERYEAEHRTTKARPGYDLTLRPPKSVSVLWALGTEEQRLSIRDAHREAVDVVVGYVETHALYARRGDGDRGKVETDGVVAAAFDHRTSRQGDPLLHTHVVTANLTRTVEGRWQAIDARPVYDHARPGGLLYQAHLRHLLSQRMGISWEPVHNGWAEIEGVPENVINEFSKRRNEIEDMVAEAGYNSARARQAATLATRKPKEHGVDAATLEGRWRAEAGALGFGIEQVAACFGHAPPTVEPDPDQLFAHLAGPDGLTKQASTFGRKEVIEALSERVGSAVGASRIEELADTFIASPRVAVLAQQPKNVERVHRRGGRRERSHDLARFSTPELLELEQRLLEWAGEGFGVQVPTARTDAVERAVTARPDLSEEQITMVRRVCSLEAPAIQVVAGRPGSGKTYAAAACVEAFVTCGVPVLGCALSATAAAELESATNLQVLTGHPSRTIARLLLDLERTPLPRGAVLLVDEASMVGTRDLFALAEHVAAVGGAVKLIGDPDQHGPVDTGGLFNALAHASDDAVVTLVANNRQADPTERAAIEEYRQGQVPAALTRFEETGRIVKSPTAAASYAAMVDDWWHSAGSGGSDPMIAGPNRVRGELNRLARRRMKAEDLLVGPSLVAHRREFAVGDWVVARHNERRLRSPSGDFVKNGSAGTVVGIDQQQRALTVEFRKEGRITLPAAYLDDGWLDHGYARTTYGVQGATLDRALYHAGDESSFEEGYVALTRGRHQARIYIVDGTALPDEESAHRGHDAEPTGLDTIAEALERRRTKQLAHEADPDVSRVVGEFSGWRLSELAEERRRLQHNLADAPPDVTRALTATSRQLDALSTKRQAWTDTLESADGPRPLSRRVARRADATRRDRASREIEMLDSSIARQSERLAELREHWTERRAYFREHAAEVDRLSLVVAADHARELQVRTASLLNPPEDVIHAVGESPREYATSQAWRNGVQDAAVYLERFGRRPGVDSTDSIASVLGSRPTEPEAAWQYQIAAASLRAAAAVEPSPSPAIELSLD